MLKRTPLYEKHLLLGAKLVPFAGWEMPVSYPSGIIAEHLAARNSAGLFDVGHMGLITVSGPGALSLIQKATTNDASKLAINHCQYSVLCNDQGGALDDLLVYRLPNYYLIIANASNADKVLHRFQALSQNAQVEFLANHYMLSLQGPKARDLASLVLSTPLDDLKTNQLLHVNDLIVSRTGYTGEDGVEIVAPVNQYLALWDLLIKQGAGPCGLGARDTLRLEAGLPLYGHEYDETKTPLEVGYSWAVKFDKGDFVGRPSLLKEKEQGLRKRLVGITLTGRAIPRQGTLVLDNLTQTQIGQVTSGTFSPTFKQPIALAFLTGGARSLGDKVLLEIRSEKLIGTIVDKVFYKRVK